MYPVRRVRRKRGTGALAAEHKAALRIEAKARCVVAQPLPRRYRIGAHVLEAEAVQRVAVLVRHHTVARLEQEAVPCRQVERARRPVLVRPQVHAAAALRPLVLVWLIHVQIQVAAVARHGHARGDFAAARMAIPLAGRQLKALPVRVLGVLRLVAAPGAASVQRAQQVVAHDDGRAHRPRRASQVGAAERIVQRPSVEAHNLRGGVEDGHQQQEQAAEQQWEHDDAEAPRRERIHGAPLPRRHLRQAHRVGAPAQRQQQHRR